MSGLRRWSSVIGRDARFVLEDHPDAEQIAAVLDRATNLPIDERQRVAARYFAAGGEPNLVVRPKLRFDGPEWTLLVELLAAAERQQLGRRR